MIFITLKSYSNQYIREPISCLLPNIFLTQISPFDHSLNIEIQKRKSELPNLSQDWFPLPTKNLKLHNVGFHNSENVSPLAIEMVRLVVFAFPKEMVLP